VTTIRLDDETAELLEAIARVEGTTMSEEMRKAIKQHIESRRNDSGFMELLKKSMERNESILKRLAK
jgi:predicted transcriptional regulator